MRFFQSLKKFGLFCLILLMFSSVFLYIPQAGARSFADVPSYYKHRQAISHLSNLGIIDGYLDGSFQPQRSMSRAEAIKLLVAANFDQTSISQALGWHQERNHWYATFYDVPTEDWFAPYVELAYQNGIVEGYLDGNFKPHKTINFAESLKIILLANNVDTSRIRFNEAPLLYVKGGDWFARYFGYAYNKNLINREKFYHPAQPMTRGEFAEILYRLKTIQTNGLQAFQANSSAYSDEYTITIPSLNIVNVNVSFADPYSSDRAIGVLKGGMGHYLSPPGSGRKMVLFGHSSGYSWDNSSYKHLLRQIDRIKVNDLIYINYKEKGHIYRVRKEEVMPANQLNKIMKDYGYEEVAMYTCWPPDSISHRYVVYAGKI